MSAVTGKVAIVTGTASGIGRALALELARRGAKLAVSDVDDAGLVETVRLIEAEVPNTVVHQQHLDVSDREAFLSYAETVAEHFGGVNQIYNNAGIASSRTILDADWIIYDKVIGVNLWGVIHGTKAFLPHLIASGDGHVTNISSLNGYFAQDELSAYCTTKFAVRGFTETLRIEMLRDKRPVKVTVVHPGGIKTSIATNSVERAAEFGIAVTDAERRRAQVYTDKLLTMDPAQAANIIIDGVEAGRARVLVGKDARLIDVIVRLFPVSYHRMALLLGKLIQMSKN
jgi:NAD(P)-dependent dehydrogenase (short-subunit alcohol dehydrogenase family)